MSNGISSFEVNFDGLVGPTHNYAGLSFGNVASSAHGGQISSPRQAALQGLEKMQTLARMGVKQAVLPPQERPCLPTLRRLGFGASTPARILDRVFKEAPGLLAMMSSASAMWAANAATVSPFADTVDGRTHITPANLSTMLHRAIEADVTSRVLRAIFQGPDYYHHKSLPFGAFADEGAANHSRFCVDHGQPGVELFVYGTSLRETGAGPRSFPARQTLEASEALARKHRLDPDAVVFARQNPEAVDAGVFHNDVIAVGAGTLLFHHELAFAETTEIKRQLDAAARKVTGSSGLDYIEVSATEVSLHDAVASYLFNSQLVNVPGSTGFTLVAPQECRKIASVNRYLTALEADHPRIDRVICIDLHQSMKNGGGPACLRLRVVMSRQQIEAMNANVFLDDSLYRELGHWIKRHYRDRLAPEELRDPALLEECQRALDELTRILALGPIYDFQRD